MKILNLDWRDYHMHTSSFSDGMNSVDEMVKFAWDIWLTEIAITDHSDVVMDNLWKKFWVFPNVFRSNIRRWKNVFNDVNVIFWVEADILNENWDVCFNIQWEESDYIILAWHSGVYKWNPETITNAYINAIKRYHLKIKFICHPCNNSDFWKYIDIEKLVKVANKYNIPLEFNTKNYVYWKTNMDKLKYLLKNTNEVYINSDAHNLFMMKNCRKEWILYLEKNNYI